MHGLINRSLECFLGDTYGADVWLDVVRTAGLEFNKFEPMLEYDDAVTYVVLDAAAHRLSKDNDTILEDLGTYLVANPRAESIRRLLRFGGVSFVEFLHSLDDLQGRVKMAVPELELPRLQLKGYRATGGFMLTCTGPHKGFGRVMMGMLRAMADDYGALVFMEDEGGGEGFEQISIVLVESSFSDGRDFNLTEKVSV